MSHPRPRQHPSVNDMQLWQQQLMHKQLQEFQRQQQLHQLDQGPRQQNLLIPSVSAKSAAQLPRVINEMPANDISNYTWPNNLVGGMSAVPNNSEMPSAGNVNWAQPSGLHAMYNLANGHILPDNESQAMQSLGFTQQLDQSFHGMPVSRNRTFANQYSQFFGMPNDATGLMAKAAGHQTEKASDPFNNFQTDQYFPEQGCSQDRISVITQNFQGKGFLGNNPMQILSSDVTSENFQQANNLQHNLQVQKYHGRQEQDDWPDDLQEKPAVQVGISSGVASLDPTEKKILFGTDNDDNWGAFGGSLNSLMGGYPHGHPSQNEYFGAFPSVHSGSWSALMQEAVQASSSSDQGVHEEWSGLSFQKMEQSMPMHSNAFNDSGKQLAAWNNSNLQNASSLTSRPLPLFYDANGDPNSHTVPSFQHAFKSSHEENNRVPNEVPNVSFQRSTGEANKIQFPQNQEQKQYVEGGFQSQMPVTNGIWAGHTYEQKENSSADMQFKSHNIAGSWAQQESMSFSSVNNQHSGSRPNGSNTSYPLASGGGSTDGNAWKLGASHVSVSGGMQPFKSIIGDSQVQTEGSLISNFGSVMNSNTFNLTGEMNQQITNRQQVVFGKNFTHDASVNSQGIENMARNQNQSSRILQNWETSTNSNNKRLVDIYDSKNEHPEVFTAEGYPSNQTNHGKNTNYRVAAKENPTLIGSHNSFIGKEKSSIQSGQQNVESSIPPSHLSNFQGLADVVFQGSKRAVSKYVRSSEFDGHDVLSNPMDVTKRIANGAKELDPRDSIPTHASSGSFDGISAQSSENKRISQSSQNMSEHLHNIDQSRNGNEMYAPVIHAQAAANVTAFHPHFIQPSNLQGFGLWLSPPSQKQLLQNFEVPPQTSLINKEAGDKDQRLCSSPPVRYLPHEASQVENWRNTSNISGQENKGTSGSDIPSDFPYVGNQLQVEQQQHIPGAKYQLERQQQQEKHVSSSSGHEALDQTVDVPLGSQGNASALVKNDLFHRQLPATHDGEAVDQSVQMSLPIPAGRVPHSGVALASDTRAPAYPEDTDHVKSSGQQLPVMETRSGSQPSMTGMSQQVGFSKMLHNVWANLSARQRLAGLQSYRIAPNILQSIINHGRDTSSWGLQKADGQGNQEESVLSEVGISSVNSQDKDHQVVVNSIKVKHVEHPGNSPSGTTFQGQELVRSSPFDGPSNFSIPSLVQQWQDVDKGKGGEGSDFHSQVVHAPVTNIASRSDACFSGCTSAPSESQQQNYSLLHQMQSMKGADSNSSMKLEKGFNASQTEQNAGQRFVYRQNTVSKDPADGKIGAVSQSSFPSDFKMLSFSSKDNERHTSISSVAEHHNLQNHIHSLTTSSSATLMGGNEHYKISPKMTSLFEKYITYKNDMGIAKYHGQTTKSSTQQYIFAKVPGSMENSSIVDQIIDSSKVGNVGQKPLAPTIAANESSALSLPSTVMDLGIVQRSKKRKSATSDLLPWHKEISPGQRRLQSTSMAELAWSQAANRLLKKVGDEAEALEDDGPLMLPPRRRLILTTQMIQQLVPAVPATVLNVEATSANEQVIYYVAKSALADSCGGIYLFGRDSCVDDGNLITKKFKSSVVGDDIFSKIGEEFSGRSKRLESEFSRLDKRTSMLDVLLECQELERFSIVNRLGKFHGRSQTDGVEGSSTLETAPRRTFTQRYVTALSVPRNLPEGVHCLSL